MSNFVPEKTALGIEFGSTRIKAVLIGPEHTPLAQGDYTWENQLHNGIWTYPLEQVWQGLQSAYAALAADVQQKYGCTLTKVGCIGISAMMHGYLAFDANGLSRSDGPLGTVEQHLHGAVLLHRHLTGLLRLAVADLGTAPELAGRRFPGDPVEILTGELLGE